MAPLDARIKKSTEEWVKSKAVREQRRRELEAEECTFYPSLGAGPGAATSASGGRSRRSSSAGPRARANASRPAGEEEGPGAAAARAFEASSSALQKARDARLKTLRKQRLQLDLQEETMFQPVGGFEGGGHRRRASAGSGKARDSAVLEGTGGGDDRLGRDAGASATGDMSAAQRKEGSSRVEKKEVIGFKVGAAVFAVFFIHIWRQACVKLAPRFYGRAVFVIVPATETRVVGAVSRSATKTHNLSGFDLSEVVVFVGSKSKGGLRFRVDGEKNGGAPLKWLTLPCGGAFALYSRCLGDGARRGLGFPDLPTLS